MAELAPMAADQNFPPGGLQMSGITEQAQLMLTEFWPKTLENIHNLNNNDFKGQELPLARIKKIMKLDEDVKMISAEAPVLFAKAAEIFISELSLRAWIHTEDNKRRTLQRNDIAMAISKFDQFDFLIDIVPREELKPTKRPDEQSRVSSNLPDQINYYLQLAQQQSQQQQQQQQQTQQQPQQTVVAQPAPATQPATQVVTAAPQAANQNVMAIQLPNGQIIQQPMQFQNQTQPQVIQVQAPQQVQQLQTVQQMQPQQQQQQQVIVQQPQTVQTAVPTTQTVVQQQPQQQQQPQTQVYQQVVTPSGEVQTVPVTLSNAQLQAIQMQLQGKQSDQPIIIQMNQGMQGTGAATQQPAQAAQLQQLQQPMYQIQQVGGQGGQQIVIHQGDGDAQADGQDAS